MYYRVLRAVNNNFIMIITMFVTQGDVQISQTDTLSYLLTPTRKCSKIVDI